MALRYSTAGMASDGNAPVSGVGQLNDGVEASANDARPTFTHLPRRLRNPRGIGLSHQGARTFNTPVPGEHESVQEDHSNTVQGNDNIPRFSHLPPHMHDPRGVRVSRPVEESNAEPVSENQVESATPETNQVRFSHLPRLHNPRGVNAVKQIQEGMSKESGREAGDEGDGK